MGQAGSVKIQINFMLMFDVESELGFEFGCDDLQGTRGKILRSVGRQNPAQLWKKIKCSQQFFFYQPGPKPCEK